ncbi:hypothetical protein VP01_178g3 [Puccinia sorghi]|uniref:Uncharacterized protein n=1 Tax=Puccinia sorghi TaxID=27349 RepID=A0A0L6VEL9_9BASI|nr:hypothetical protein VP01_178g3 [Puccinia sorghi]
MYKGVEAGDNPPVGKPLASPRGGYRIITETASSGRTNKGRGVVMGWLLGSGNMILRLFEDVESILRVSNMFENWESIHHAGSVSMSSHGVNLFFVNCQWQKIGCAMLTQILFTNPAFTSPPILTWLDVVQMESDELDQEGIAGSVTYQQWACNLCICIDCCKCLSDDISADVCSGLMMRWAGGYKPVQQGLMGNKLSSFPLYAANGPKPETIMATTAFFLSEPLTEPVNGQQPLPSSSFPFSPLYLLTVLLLITLSLYPALRFVIPHPSEADQPMLGLDSSESSFISSAHISLNSQPQQSHSSNTSPPTNTTHSASSSSQPHSPLSQALATTAVAPAQQSTTSQSMLTGQLGSWISAHMQHHALGATAQSNSPSNVSSVIHNVHLDPKLFRPFSTLTPPPRDPQEQPSQNLLSSFETGIKPSLDLDTLIQYSNFYPPEPIKQ